MTHSTHKKAFTLLEMLIAMTIFVLFLTATSGSYLFLARTIYDANQLRRMYSSGQNIMTLVSDNLKKGIIDYDCYAERSVLVPVNSVVDRFCLDNQLTGTSDLVIINKAGTERFAIKSESTEEGVSLWITKRVKSGVDLHGRAIWEKHPDYAEKEWYPLSVGKNVLVNSMNFRVTPIHSPYSHAEDTLYQFHPQVTVTLLLQTALSYDPHYILPVQTTLSSRVYNQ